MQYVYISNIRSSKNRLANQISIYYLTIFES